MELYAEDQGVIFALVALGWCISEVASEEMEQHQVHEMPEQAYESPTDSLFFSYCLANIF